MKKPERERSAVGVLSPTHSTNVSVVRHIKATVGCRKTRKIEQIANNITLRQPSLK